MTSFHYVLQIMLAKLMISLDITLFLHFFLAECVFFDKKLTKLSKAGCWPFFAHRLSATIPPLLPLLFLLCYRTNFAMIVKTAVGKQSVSHKIMGDSLCCLRRGEDMCILIYLASGIVIVLGCKVPNGALFIVVG